MTEEAIRDAVHAMGLGGRDVAVHSSLRAFGHVVGGSDAVVSALLTEGDTILVPSFCEIGRINAPSNDRPQQNAWDYDAQPIRTHIVPFDPTTFDRMSGTNVEEMGRIPAALLMRRETVRSKHPSVSWAANGPRAVEYTLDHRAEDPNCPIKRLVEAEGYVLLLGVDLSVCTAVHYVEELCGRRPFIRWVLYADGVVRRIREYGCSDGFRRLEPEVESLATRYRIGKCNAVAYPLRQFVDALSQVIRSRPEITLCGREGCRCEAALRGGPIA